MDKDLQGIFDSLKSLIHHEKKAIAEDQDEKIDAIRRQKAKLLNRLKTQLDQIPRHNPDAQDEIRRLRAHLIEVLGAQQETMAQVKSQMQQIQKKIAQLNQSRKAQLYLQRNKK